MEDRYFTKLEKCFEVSYIATMYHFNGMEREPDPVRPYQFWHLMYVCDGKINIKTERGDVHLGRGDVIFRAPDEVYEICGAEFLKSEFIIISFVCNSPLMDYFSIQKAFSLSYEERSLLTQATAIGIAVFDVIDSKTGKFGCRLKDSTPKTTIQLLKNSIERFLLMLYVRTNDFGIINRIEKENTRNRYRELTTECIDYMEANLIKKLSVGSIARELSVSASLLKKAFMQETGQSIMHYLADFKIEQAKKMIKESSMTFSMIANELGYSSPNYFYAAFKAKTGLTPSEYSKTSTE